MGKGFVIKIGKLYIKRSYQGCNREYLGFGFTSDVNEAKRFYEKEPVTTVKNESYKNKRTVQVVSSDGLEYANFVAEQLGGQVYEVQTTIKLSKV
ncbi:hypothetical protein NXK88_001953 [Enterococcus hirae]|uniref:hypothetical protein n=1 Tax=Enterococcus hirae TaxID=1354 RepID=UPI00207418E6|nr:hypothetical protein [Enterococcus hirae]EMF0202722.1 hypothetical protein [Enterococcus hirae]